MALSVDSARHRWQPRGALGPCQALSESAPLLLSAAAKPKLCLNTRRIVLPDNGRQCKDWKQAPTVYSRNRIQTTKYTWVTFLPRNLLRQFHRLGNLYFFFLVVLNWFPQVEVFHREITMLPLLLVLLFSMSKDAVEDYRKYQYDKTINFTKTRQSFVDIWDTELCPLPLSFLATPRAIK
uniref:P-type ATPase N-terminal domain-containing protein n=1 Tax=Junco hyemalis TaxID=40217 RepID=A0A8C5J2R7_JUNHY